MSEKDADVIRSAQKPDGLILLVTAGLSAHGFDVQLTGCEGGCRLRVSGPDVRSDLLVTDCGYVAWDCWPRAAEEADPKQIADIVTTLLTGNTGEFPRKGNGYGNPALAFKAVVAMELKARGLTVNLNVWPDRTYYEATAVIVATDPAHKYAKATVGDDGAVIWEHDFWPESATFTRKPKNSGEITEPEKLAGNIVATICHVMTLAGTRGDGP